MGQSVTTKDLRAWYGNHEVLHGITVAFDANCVTAIIGPSGCGKSTFVRCLNRLHETLPDARWEGQIVIGDRETRTLNEVKVRQAVGMVFQRPNPFPTMSIFDNVALGPRLSGTRRRKEMPDHVEACLRRAALWDEVKDRLNHSATRLSGGQQQRLCIARALAMEPDVLLMDEPASSLDPSATLRVEELIGELKTSYTIVIVTHNMQQASRIADKTAFFLSGELIEYDATGRMFTQPKVKETEDYITGRFG
ncbi:MAG: phosphate ABC transporter ATP-binding protein PstB [Bacilli bacterium]